MYWHRSNLQSTHIVGVKQNCTLQKQLAAELAPRRSTSGPTKAWFGNGKSRYTHENWMAKYKNKWCIQCMGLKMWDIPFISHLWPFRYGKCHDSVPQLRSLTRSRADPPEMAWTPANGQNNGGGLSLENEPHLETTWTNQGWEKMVWNYRKCSERMERNMKIGTCRFSAKFSQDADPPLSFLSCSSSSNGRPKRQNWIFATWRMGPKINGSLEIAVKPWLARNA